jgi:hypothetical protein
MTDEQRAKARYFRESCIAGRRPAEADDEDGRLAAAEAYGSIVATLRAMSDEEWLAKYEEFAGATGDEEWRAKYEEFANLLFGRTI